MNSEKKIVMLSMLMLVFMIAFIYVVFYDVRGDAIKEQIKTIVIKSLESGDESKQQVQMTGIQEQTKNTDKPITTKTGIKIVEDTGTLSKELNKLFMTDQQKADYRVLSGTKPWYGQLSLLDELSLNYKYILKDDKEIYYVYLGTGAYDFREIMSNIGGMIITYSGSDIEDLGLFGKKVVFLSVPKYVGKKKLITFRLQNNELWFVICSFDKWLPNKAYIKSLFTLEDSTQK